MVHDWGGLIGLRWACEHPDAVWALVISNTGFFADGRWHGLARALRTPGEGEQFVDNMTQPLLAAALREQSPSMTDEAIGEYWKAFGDDDRRRAQLELYRSGDFEKLRPYEGKLADLAVPTLILWGANDPFAPPGGAQRFHREIPGSQLVLFEDAGHFVFADRPVEAAQAVRRFLDEASSGP